MITTKKSAMQDFSDTIISALADAENTEELKWHKPWRDICTSYRNAFSGHKYTGLHNILVCGLSEFADPRYATFNQIKKAGARLIKGSKSTRLIAWKFCKTTDKKGNDKSIPFATSWCLFNVEQIEGYDFPPVVVLNEENKVNSNVMDLYNKLNVNYNMKVSNKAYYDPSKDSIVVPDVKQYDNEDRHSNTALHELIHWTAHKDRCNRDLKNYHFDINERAMEELVAELGAMFLGMNLKINGYMDKENLAYIKNWRDAANGKNGDKFIYKACRLAEDACKYIMTNSGLLVDDKDESHNED